MDNKPKINSSAYLSFGIALLINLPLVITFIGTRIFGNDGRQNDFYLVIILAPVGIVAIISGIRGVILAVSKEIGGFNFAVLGIIGGIIPLVRIWSYFAEISSIQG